MKAIALALGAGVLLTAAACTPRPDEATIQRIAALEARVETLEKRNADLALKARIVSGLFGSPLENFFNSPEFWENTYDSGQADCAKRCIEALTAERAACAAIADEAQRLKCYQDATARASNCQTQCSVNNPPPIP